jgi:hypothetical protein
MALAVDLRTGDMSRMTRNTLDAAKWHDRVAVIFCVAILILALVVGRFHQVGGFSIETDFYGVYGVQAKEIMAGRPYTYQHNPPGFVILLAAVSLVTGDLFAAAKIITACSTALFGWITYLLLKALYDAQTALAATVLLLITLLPFSFLAARDIVGAVLFMLPMWVLLRRSTLALKACLVAGILAGLAYLCCYDAICAIVGIGLSLLFTVSDRDGWSKHLTRVGLFVCAVLLTISPWLIINWQTNGHPFASTVHLQIAAHFYHPAGDVFVMRDTFDFDSLPDVVLYDLPRVLQRYFRDVLYRNIRLLVEQVLRFPLYVFAGAGLLLLLKDLSRRRMSFWLVYALKYFALGLVGFHLRYYFFLFPALFLLAVYFIFREHVALGSERGLFSDTTVNWLLVIVLAFFASMSAYDKIKRTLASEPSHVFEIAAFLQSRSSPDDIIIALKGHYSYHSGLNSAYFPAAETVDDFIGEARKVGARYIIYSDLEASQWPGLRSLSDPSALPDDFRLVYCHEPTNTLIYEINKSKRGSRLKFFAP